MVKKSHPPEQIINKLREAKILINSGGERTIVFYCIALWITAHRFLRLECRWL